MRKKKEAPLASFIWCGAVVQVYTQTVTFAGTVIQRHLLPKNLRSAVQQAVNQAVEQAVNQAVEQAVNQAVEKAVNKEVARGEIRQDSTPRHVQQNQRRVRNVEQQHYGVSARASQRRSRSGG